MSFVITLYVREGIVMAADSRLTLNTTREEGEKKLVSAAVAQSDSNYKLFLAPGNVGISTFGAADIAGVPIAGFIESFMQEQLAEKPLPPSETSESVLAFFKKFSPPPAAQFHIGGYAFDGGSAEQQVWNVNMSENTVSRLNPPEKQGAAWGGEGDILSRLLMPMAEVDQQGKIVRRPPFFPIPWQFFTLQDAIDFAVFSVRSTIEAIRFQPRPKTVGGPIDVLVLKPNAAQWVQRKALTVTYGS
jgi:hypothetical protein